MEFFYAFMIIAAGIYPAHSAYDCETTTRFHMPCSHHELPREFPETKDELMKACPLLIGRFECEIDFEEQCPSDMHGLLFAGRNILAALQEICNNDTLLHAAVVDNLKCFKELREDRSGSCYEDAPTVEKLRLYAQALVERGIVAPSDNMYHTYACLRAMHFVVCSGLKIEKCGEVAMKVFVELLRNVSFLEMKGCHEDIGKYLPTLLRIYKQEKQANDDAEQALKKIGIFHCETNPTTFYPCYQFKYAIITAPGGFPETKDDLMKICPPLIAYFDCGIDFVEECQDEHARMIPAARATVATLRKVCNEDTLLHATVVDNLKCFKTHFWSRRFEGCYTDFPVEERLRSHAQALVEEGIVAPCDNMNDTYSCLKAMHYGVCNAVRIEKKCGKVAMEVFVEVLRESKFFEEESCDEEDIDKYLPALLRIYKLKEEAKDDVKQALKEEEEQQLQK